MTFELRRRCGNLRGRRDVGEPEFVVCDIPDCQGGSRGQNTGHRVAVFDVFILGRPVGRVCERHGRELRRAWDTAHDDAAVLEAVA